MTHILEVPTSNYNAVLNGTQQFDILKFGRRVSVGDTIVYQRLADTEDEESEDAFTDDEVSVVISYIFEDEEKAIKNGFTAVGFKEKQPND